MFAVKKNYFLIVESIKDINLKNIKKRSKFSVIYRNKNKIEDFDDLFNFRRFCRLKSIKFYVANDEKLALKLHADGIYISAFNTSLKLLSLKKYNFQMIGSAHNFKEISLKLKQGCDQILFSKLFKVSYDEKAPFLGIIKFNSFLRINKNLIPLGGINSKNLNSLRSLNCSGFAILSEIKKKPVNIVNRLF